ncbi:hypothetical protein [Frigoribacterium sp. UYMn621]|uniref:hypothetical protein n=1 Tax=Frigoribacterium sp. UYMn621 TaxID=3156343 RepID=UPI003393D237
MLTFLMLCGAAALSLTSACGWLGEVAPGFIQRGEGEELEPVTQLHYLELLGFLFDEAEQAAGVSFGYASIDHSPLRL